MKARLKDGNIDGRQAMALLVVASGAKLFLFFPRVMVEAAATAGWMVVLLSAFSAGALVLVLTKLVSGLGRDYSLEEAVDAGLGPAGALVTGVSLSLLFFADLALTGRQLAEALITTVLPNTPISVITALLFLVALYGAYLGIEPLSRVAWLVVPWTALGLLLGAVLVLPYTRVDQLFPLLGFGADVVLSRGIAGTSYFVNFLLILVIRPFLRRPERAAALTVGVVALVGPVMAAVVAQFVMVFAMPLACAVAFPLLQMMQLVVQRVEAAFIFVWVITGILKLGVGLYVSTLLLARGLGLPVWRPLLFPIATLAFSANFMPESMVEALEWEARFLRDRAGPVAFALPLLLVGMSRLILSMRKKRGGDG